MHPLVVRSWNCAAAWQHRPPGAELLCANGSPEWRQVRLFPLLPRGFSSEWSAGEASIRARLKHHLQARRLLEQQHGTLVVYTCCMLYPCDRHGVGGPDEPVTVRLCVSGSVTASNLEQESASCELGGAKGTVLCCSACAVSERLVPCRRKSGPYGLQETSKTSCRNHSTIDPSKAPSSASPTNCRSTFRDVCPLPDPKSW